MRRGGWRWLAAALLPPGRQRAPAVPARGGANGGGGADGEAGGPGGGRGGVRRAGQRGANAIRGVGPCRYVSFACSARISLSDPARRPRGPELGSTLRWGPSLTQKETESLARSDLTSLGLESGGRGQGRVGEGRHPLVNRALVTGGGRARGSGQFRVRGGFGSSRVWNGTGVSRLGGPVGVGLSGPG